MVWSGGGLRPKGLSTHKSPKPFFGTKFGLPRMTFLVDPPSPSPTPHPPP